MIRLTSVLAVYFVVYAYRDRYFKRVSFSEVTKYFLKSNRNFHAYTLLRFDS